MKFCGYEPSLTSDTLAITPPPEIRVAGRLAGIG
jgi:hypothetical protein